MTTHDRLEAIRAALAGLTNRVSSEYALQRAVGGRLPDATPEFLCPAGRIDFAWQGIGIECKVAGSPAEHIRQLMRYEPHFDGLVLITTTRIDRAGIEASLEKPFLAIRLQW